MAPGMVHAMEPAGQEDLIFKIVIPCEMFEKIEKGSPDTVQKLGKVLDQGMIQILRSGGQMRSLMELLAREQLCEGHPRAEVLGLSGFDFRGDCADGAVARCYRKVDRSN